MITDILAECQRRVTLYDREIEGRRQELDSLLTKLDMTEPRNISIMYHGEISYWQAVARREELLSLIFRCEQSL